MRSVENKRVFARREIVAAGVVGTAYLILPEGCGTGASDSPDAGQADSTTPDVAPADSPDFDAGVADVEPEATLVEGGGDCKQDDWTRPISIMEAGIAIKGTAYAFSDDRFVDLAAGGNRIIAINPLAGSGYVAMSGVCTHMACSPQYFPTCLYSTPDGIPQCVPPETSEAGADAGLDGEAPDGAETAGGGMLLTDVLYCPCHGSVFNALDGKAMMGPALIKGNLQLMETCVGGGYLFIRIPRNPGAP